MENLSTNFLQQVCNLLDDARKNVKTAVNLSMVYTYYNIGRMITEEEQKGNDRADYGKYVLKELSLHLVERFGKGF